MPWLTLGLGIWLAIGTGCGSPVAKSGSGARNLPATNAAAAPAEPLDDVNASALASSIRRVTVYSDRALVSREAKVELSQAPTVYAFEQLPGWVDDGSVRAAIDHGRIVDVRVTRRYLAQANAPTYRRAEAKHREIASRLQALDDELKVIDAQAKQIEDIKAFSLTKLNEDVLKEAPAPSAAPERTGSVSVHTYAGVVDFIGKELRALAKGRRAIDAERQKLTPELEASSKGLEELQALTQLEETRVLVSVQGAAPGEAKLELSYMLPGATWESTHDLRTEGSEPNSADVTSFAVVTQATGEDWDDAELTFSTQSSTTAVRIPELEALTLGETRAATQNYEMHSASFKRAELAFKGQNLLWNKRIHGSETGQSFEESYQTNFESLSLTQSKTVQIFQSLQQRGTTAQFRAQTPAHVRPDGRGVRVPIGHASLKAKKSIVAAPEQSLNAAQTLELANDSGQPLLPGAVALYQSGAFLGLTNVDFVAAGEKFPVFLSVADQLKLTRTIDKLHSAIVRKQRTQMQLAFIVTVENLSSKPITFNLADRIPVSEDKDIIVSGVKVSPDAKPDSKGILRFPITLQPQEKRRIDIQYQIEYPPTLVLEMKRNSAVAAPAPLPGAPAMPAPRRSYDIRKDIEQLESTF